MNISNKDEYVDQIRRKISNNELIVIKPSEIRNNISKYDVIRIFE